MILHVSDLCLLMSAAAAFVKLVTLPDRIVARDLSATKITFRNVTSQELGLLSIPFMTA